MKIKEVEQLTGLTAKTIRFYESEKLISVDRSDNIYRDYDDETVRQLLEIKLYRKFDIGISDLMLWKTGKLKITDLLADCLSSYENVEKSIESKKELCKAILIKARTGLEIDSLLYLETLELLESDEYDKLKKTLDEIGRGTIFSQFYFSLILCAPIGWLFINYYGLKDYKALAINIPLASIALIVLTISWMNFIHVRKFNIRNVLIGIGKLILNLFGFVALIASAIGVFALVGLSAELLFIPNDYLFYSTGLGAVVALTVFLIEFACVFLLIVDFISHKKGNRKTEYLKPYIKKTWYVIVALNIVMFYLISTSLFIVSPDKIINHRTISPFGKEYSFYDIKEINTGADGDVFYYEATMTDGKIFDFVENGMMYGSNDMDHQYTYLAAIDEIAINAGVVKSISSFDITKIKPDDPNIKEILNYK